MFFRRFRLSAGHLKESLTGLFHRPRLHLESDRGRASFALRPHAGLYGATGSGSLHPVHAGLRRPGRLSYGLGSSRKNSGDDYPECVSYEEGLSPLWAVRRSFWHAAASARASCTKRSDTPRVTISDITVPARASPVANEMIASPINKMTRGLRVAVSNCQSQPR